MRGMDCEEESIYALLPRQEEVLPKPPMYRSQVQHQRQLVLNAFAAACSPAADTASC